MWERVWRAVGEGVEGCGRGCRGVWERVQRVVGEDSPLTS